MFDPSTGITLAEHQGWIYKKSGKDGKWKKLIPGSNPQWTKSGHFYYFLRVGYSAYAELWQANSDGGNY